jgi:hypothetical protein
MRPRILLTIIVLLSAPIVSAATPTPADVLVEKGIALRQQGKNQEALDLFQQAHATSPSGRTLAQMGLAEASLRRWVESELHLSAALDSHDTPWIENAKNRDALSHTLLVVRSHVGLLLIDGPPGVDVIVAGNAVGRLPLRGPLHVAEGSVRIEGNAQGRESAAVNLTVPGGEQQSVRLDMPLIPPAPAAAQQSAPLIDAHPVDEATPWRTWTGGGLLAVSAGLIATGIVWIAIDGGNTCSPPAGYRCARVYDTKTQGWIAAGIGAAVGVTGGVLLWRGRHTEAHVGLGLGTLSAGGTF